MLLSYILLGIDFKDETYHIIDHAVHLSKKTKARLRIIHIIDYFMTPPMYIEPYLKIEKQNAMTKMNVLMEYIKEQGIAVDGEVLSGHIVETFIRETERWMPDVVMIGYKSHALRASTSERLIRTLKRPLFIIKTRKEPSISSILCPIDFSTTSENALKTAIAIKKQYQGRLFILHVIQTIGEREVVERIKKDVEQRVDGILIDQQINDIQRLIITGIPHEVIVEIAKKKGCDLIVIGSKGHSIIKNILIGSTTEAVLRSAPCNVFIIR